MNQPNNVWKNERGSALLLILVGVVVAGIMFGGLYLSLDYSHRLAVSEELRVQAEYDAQKMMDIGLSYYYQGATAFDAVFSGNGSCLTEGAASVCLQVAADNSRTFVATGNRTRDTAVLQDNETSTIRYALDTAAPAPSPDPGPVTPVPGNTNPAGPAPDEPLFGPASPGQTCGQMASGGIPLKAFALGETFDTTRAAASNDYPTLYMEGGLYIGNLGSAILSKSNHRNIEINGYSFAENGLGWDTISLSTPQYKDLGSRAQQDTCSRVSNFHDQLNQLANYYLGSVQPFDVYHFVGNPVTMNSTGCKQTHGFTNCNATSDTLMSVFWKKEAKVVLIEGSVQFPSTMLSTGYLIVYPGTKLAPSTIYMPDKFTWAHLGAVATEQVRTSPTSGVWPRNYTLAIRLTDGQVSLYKRTH